MEQFISAVEKIYFTWQWYTPWLLTVGVIAAFFGHLKDRNPVACFLAAYFLSPLGAVLYIMAVPRRTWTPREPSGAPVMELVVLALVIPLGWLAIWPPARFVSQARAFTPQVVTVKRPVAVQADHGLVDLSPGTRVWAMAESDGKLVVRVGRGQALLAAEAVELGGRR